MTILAAIYLIIAGFMWGFGLHIYIVNEARRRYTHEPKTQRDSREPKTLAFIGTLSALAGVVLTVWQP